MTAKDIKQLTNKELLIAISKLDNQLVLQDEYIWNIDYLPEQVIERWLVG